MRHAAGIDSDLNSAGGEMWIDWRFALKLKLMAKCGLERGKSSRYVANVLILTERGKTSQSKLSDSVVWQFKL